MHTTSRLAIDADVSASATRTRVWLALAIASFALFAVLAVLVAGHVALPLDQSLLDRARTMSGLNSIWRLLSDAANIPLIVIGVGIVLWLLWKGRRREAILVIIVLVAATAGSEAVKQLVGRPRPLGTDPAIPGVVYSFPSGHVLEAGTIFGIIGIMVWRGRWPLAAKGLVAIVFTIFVLLVAVARVALAEHYPSDVLAGLLAGIGDLSIFAAFSQPRRSEGAEEREARPETG